MWPIQFHLLLWISSLIFFTPVSLEIVWFQMGCGHQILRIRLRHVNWNLSSFFSSAAVSFHASHPYNRTGRSQVLDSLIFVLRPMLRVFQIFLLHTNYTFLDVVPATTFFCHSRNQIYKLFDILYFHSSNHYFVFSSCIYSHHFAFWAVSFSPTLPALPTSWLVLFCTCMCCGHAGLSEIAGHTMTSMGKSLREVSLNWNFKSS